MNNTATHITNVKKAISNGNGLFSSLTFVLFSKLICDVFILSSIILLKNVFLMVSAFNWISNNLSLLSSRTFDECEYISHSSKKEKSSDCLSPSILRIISLRITSLKMLVKADKKLELPLYEQRTTNVAMAAIKVCCEEDRRKNYYQKKAFFKNYMRKKMILDY